MPPAAGTAAAGQRLPSSFWRWLSTESWQSWHEQTSRSHSPARQLVAGGGAPAASLERLRHPADEHRDRELDLGPAGIVLDRRQRAQVGDDRERVLVAQRPRVRDVGHLREERATVPADALAHRAEHLAVGHGADAGLLVGREVRRAEVDRKTGELAEIAAGAELTLDRALAGHRLVPARASGSRCTPATLLDEVLASREGLGARRRGHRRRGARLRRQHVELHDQPRDREEQERCRSPP